MKGLLLMLILSPFILFGQTRQKAMVDSIKAASTNIQKVSNLIGKYPGTRIENIQVSDSDEYVTVLVRIHAGDIRTVSLLSPASVVEVKAKETYPHKFAAVEVPPLPFIFEKDTILTLAARPVVDLHIGDVSFVKLEEVPLPPLPLIRVEIEALSLLALTQIKMEEIAFDKLEIAMQPPLPLVKVEMETLALLALAQIKVENIVLDKIETVAEPPLPLVKVEMITLPLLSLTQIKIGDLIFDKLEMATEPPLPLVKVEMEALPLLAIIEVKTDITFDKVNQVDALPFPELEPGVPMTPAALVQVTIEARPVRRMRTVVVPVFEEDRNPIAEMHLSDEGYALLEKMEGFSPELYALGDGGLTIGFGFFVSFSEADKWRKGVTWEAAEQMMRQKVPNYEDQVKKYINVALTQEEFDALTMLAYNLGGFSKATSIVNDINGNADYEQLQKDWMRFVHSKAPNVMKGLMNRRNDELQVKNSLDYQPERKVLIFKNRK